MRFLNWLFRFLTKREEPPAPNIEENSQKEPKMDKFDRAMKFVFRWEGGYVNHKSDPGGETNFGISKRSHPNVDIKNLTEEGAKEIYRDRYWNKIKGNELPELISIAVMDYAVNSGVERSSIALQNIVGSKADGAIGPNTIKKVKEAVSKKSDKKIAQEIVLARSDFLSDIVKRSPDMSAFLKGWMRRTHSCLIEISS